MSRVPKIWKLHNKFEDIFKDFMADKTHLKYLQTRPGPENHTVVPRNCLVDIIRRHGRV